MTDFEKELKNMASELGKRYSQSLEREEWKKKTAGEIKAYLSRKGSLVEKSLELTA